MASIAKYKEENRRLKEKLDNTVLGDEDVQAILDQIDSNNRIIEELSKKEKIVIPIHGQKVGPAKKAKKHATSGFGEGKVII